MKFCKRCKKEHQENTKMCLACNLYYIEYYRNNKSYQLSQKKYKKKYYQKNKKTLQEKATEYTRNRRQTNINVRIAHNLRNRTRQYLKTKDFSLSILSVLGCSIEELKNHIEKKFIDTMSWDNYGQWEIDHILPLSKFNLQNLEDMKKACHYSNLQPLWKKDNILKTNKS